MGLIRRLLVPAALIATLAAAGTALASSHGTIVKLRNTKLGKVLAGRSGHLLYIYAPDKRNKDVCVTKNNGCMQVWPPLTTSAKPVAQGGVKKSLLGTIKLPNGKKQVTYAGHPLYNWIDDPGGGDTSYVGVTSTGGRWYAISATGKVLKG